MSWKYVCNGSEIYLKKFGIQTKAVLACISVLTLETMTQDAFDKIEIEILKLLNYWILNLIHLNVCHIKW